MPELVIRGGALVTPQGLTTADLAIDDGRITEIGSDLPGAAEEIDARGLTVMPGLIDVHLHFNEPGRVEWEGAFTGSRAFASGGGTLYFDMPLNSSPCTVGGAEFDAKRDALERTSLTDFGLWGGIVPGNRDRLEQMAERGAIGFKAFMTDSGLPEFPRADDLTLYEGMREAARLGLPVAVHAESQELVQALTARALTAGLRDIRGYLDSRPVLAEVEAIQRAALLAGEAGAKLHVVHVSSGRGVAAAIEARGRGVDISIETCAHYLHFTGDDMLRMGTIAKCAPPLRTQAERDALWRAVESGQVDIVASDHSPAPMAMKTGDNFFTIWGGIAGVESTRAVLFERLDAMAVAVLTALHPAQRFGIANKGRLEVGCDADLALVDLNRTYTVDKDALFQKHRLSPYAGVRFRGIVRRTLLRGLTIFLDGKIVAGAQGRMVQTTNAATRTYS